MPGIGWGLNWGFNWGGSPAPGAVLLDVYEDDGTTIAWSVSTDPNHATPYLMQPQHYGAQEIDPVSGAATLAQVEVGVIDPATTPGDQQTGWMTARLADVRGRRCRLTRYAPELGTWHLIVDGPGGMPRLDETYAAYRWVIRDTREVERRLTAFGTNGRASIIPSRGPNPPIAFNPTTGAIDGFGYRVADDSWILEPVVPLAGVLTVEETTSGKFVARVDLSALWDFSGVDPVVPGTLVLPKAGEAAFAFAERDGVGVFTEADILWRLVGETDWNVSRPVIPMGEVIQPLAVVAPAVYGSAAVRAVSSVILWFAAAAPAGMPSTPGTAIEIIVRFRGPASEDYPAYYEGTLGGLLAELYDGTLAGAPAQAGDLYDPAGLDDTIALLAGGVRYDAAALAELDTPVLIRATEPVTDGRDWSEKMLYAPSGWIPATDIDGKISPVSRERPIEITAGTLTDANSRAEPVWDMGERVVTGIVYRHRRYFRPTFVGIFPPESDGVAIRPVELRYLDPEAIGREGEQLIEFDATAFAAIGDSAGSTVGEEAGATFAHAASFEVLERYRIGARTFRTSVLRSVFPTLRVGAWMESELSWLPHHASGERGQATPAVQVLSIGERNAAWRDLLVEEADVTQTPGYFSLPDLIADAASPGYLSAPEVIADTESMES